MSPKAVRTALKNLATGSEAYDQVYKEAMERINGQVKDQAELAKQILGWITCALRPLTTVELQHALAVEIGESQLDEENLPNLEDMISACVGLVTVDEESDIIRLVHYTTQEYFERMQREYFPNAETDITMICVTYLSFDVFGSGFYGDFIGRLWSNKLFRYAAENWGHHARKASPLTQCLSQTIVGFLRNEDKVKASGQGLLALRNSWYGYDLRAPPMTGMHLVSYFGVMELSKLLLDASLFEADIKDGWGQTPLWIASQGGHEAVVKLLLDTGEVEVDSRGYDKQTPLWAAAQEGHDTIVKLLLNIGADANSKNYLGQTTLSVAAQNGHEAIVRLLLDAGADAKSKEHCGNTALLAAAEGGHEAIVKLLLDTGINADSKGCYANTPLSMAAENGHEAIVKLLLDKGADVNSTNRYSNTPLSLARERGHEGIVKLLLNNRVDPNSKDTSRESVLSIALKD